MLSRGNRYPVWKVLGVSYDFGVYYSLGYIYDEKRYICMGIISIEYLIRVILWLLLLIIILPSFTLLYYIIFNKFTSESFIKWHEITFIDFDVFCFDVYFPSMTSFYFSPTNPISCTNVNIFNHHPFLCI